MSPLVDCSDEEIAYPVEGEALVIRCALNMQIKEDNVDQQRKNIFHTQCHIQNKVCSMIIDGGSCANVASDTDMIQARSNSDFDVKSATIQFYGNNHNSQFDRWIKLQCYVESPDMFTYFGLKFRSIGVWEGILIRVNSSRVNFVIYFLLTCGLPIWL